MTINKKPKFPKFTGHLYAQGLNIKLFAEMLRNKGYQNYNYNNVRKKIKGESALEYEDMIVFSRVLGVDETIFFD